MIVTVTDFGPHEPYLAQMEAAILSRSPTSRVLHLFSDAPAFEPLYAGYLLQAYRHDFPAGTVFLAVVDPGVGSGQRSPVVLEADGQWFVGPGNGLFDPIAVNSQHYALSEIVWTPPELSASFHGRDLFAPIAAFLDNENLPMAYLTPLHDYQPRVGRDLSDILYIDHFGNAITGIWHESIDERSILYFGDKRVAFARTFSDVPKGVSFWYINANGLVEIAANMARAADLLNLTVGDKVTTTSYLRP